MTPERIIDLIATYNHMLALERAGVAPTGFARNWADATLDADAHDVVLAYISRSQKWVSIVQAEMTKLLNGGVE